MDQCPVLIVGAGPTGLVLALWLTRLGIPVRIIDKTPAPGTTSRALAVQARTLELYRQIDLSSEITQAGVQVPAVNLWVAGERASRVSLGGVGEGLSPFPFVLIYPQEAHEQLLIRKLDELGVKVERQTELIHFDLGPQEARATLRSPDGSEKICQARYLAGCDGAHSKVRELIGVGFPGGTYSGVCYVADVSVEGPVANGEIHVDFEEADFLAVFPLKGQGRVRLVGPLSEESGPKSREPTFEDIKGRAVKNLKLTLSQVNWFSTYHVHHRVAKHFRMGRAFLLGDAAHIHSPVGGQGMNTGIGDAVNLAWKLAAVLKGQANESLLDSYEPERIAFANQLVATTDRLFTLVTKQGKLARWVRTRAVPQILPSLFRIGSLRRRLFRTVSQIDVNYRKSPLSVGGTGSLRAGDRLPWLEYEGGKSNFDSLTALSWQVHVYGERNSELTQLCTHLNLPLQIFPWDDRARRVGLRQNALYLVRPDGYIALADSKGDPERLRSYFRSIG